MPSASAKLEKQASIDANDPLKQALNVIEKKVRNLEKRKVKLDTYRAESAAGRELNEDQKNAIKKYDEVLQTLEFAKELQKNFVTISQDNVKAAKKQAKRDQMERQIQETQRVRELLVVQDVLNNMGLDHIRNCFLNGSHGALLLTEDNLTQLDELYKLISPSREVEEGGPRYEEQLNQASDHLVALLESKNKEVLGTTYKDLRALITTIHECGFLNGPYALQKESVENEGEEEAEEVEEEAEEEEEELEEEAEGAMAGGEEKSVEYRDEPEEDYSQVEPEPEMVSSEVLPGVVDAAVPATLHHPSQAPALMDNYFSTTPTYPPSRPINEVISAVQGSFNFLQESQIDLESPHMDPAVVAAHPMAPAPIMNYPSQQADAVSQYAHAPRDDGSSPQPMAGNQVVSQYPTQNPPSQQPTMTQPMAMAQADYRICGPAPDLSGYKPTPGQAIPPQPIPTQTFTNQSFVAMQGLPPNSAAPNFSPPSAYRTPMDQSLNAMSHATTHGQPVSSTAGTQTPPPAEGGLGSLQSPPGSEPKKHLMNVNAVAFESVAYKPPNALSNSPTPEPSQSQPLLTTEQSAHYASQPVSQQPSSGQDSGDASSWSSKAQPPGSYPHQVGQQTGNFPARNTFGNGNRGGRGGGRGTRGTSSNGFSSRGRGGGNFNNRGGGNYQGYRGEGQTSGYFQGNYQQREGYSGNNNNNNNNSSPSSNNYSNGYKRGNSATGRGGPARGTGNSRGGNTLRGGSSGRGGYVKSNVTQ